MQTVAYLKSLKAEIIKFVQGQYRKTGKVPSVGETCQQLQTMGLNKTVFYTVFPHGIMEVCENSGVPLPRERVLRTCKARKTREDIKGSMPNEDKGSPHSKPKPKTSVKRRKFGIESSNSPRRLAELLKAEEKFLVILRYSKNIAKLCSLTLFRNSRHFMVRAASHLRSLFFRCNNNAA